MVVQTGANELPPPSTSSADDARICPQDGSVCWEPNCNVDYCRGVAEGRQSELGGIVSHWFIQGGAAEFGEIKGNNSDEIVASILNNVRTPRPRAASMTGRRRCNVQGPRRYQVCGRYAGHDGPHREMGETEGWTGADSHDVDGGQRE